MIDQELQNYMLEKSDTISKMFGGVKSRISYQIKNDKQCKSEYKNRPIERLKINCNNDIDSLINRVSNIIQQYSTMMDNDKKLFYVDFFLLDLAILSCITAIDKAARNLDNSNCNFKYNKEDVDVIFKKLEICSKQLSELSLRKSCQD